MLRFKSPLITQDHPEPGKFVVYKDFLLDFEFKGKVFRGAVPRCYITDFASVPKVVQLLPGFDVNGDSREPAVWHDYLYSSNGRIPARLLTTGELVDLELTREDCDWQFFDALLTKGYSSVQTGLFFAGVRTGGWLYWNKRVAGISSKNFVSDSFWTREYL